MVNCSSLQDFESRVVEQTKNLFHVMIIRTSFKTEVEIEIHLLNSSSEENITGSC